MAFLKRNKDKSFDSDVPEFSENKPSSTQKDPEYPDYEKEFGTIKQEISKPVSVPKVEIPVRQKGTRASPVGEKMEDGKPVFVKLDNYKEARDSVDKIKGLVKNAGSLLEEVHKIKEEEDRELQNWHNNLDKLKDKLLDLDKKLFDL